MKNTPFNKDGRVSKGNKVSTVQAKDTNISPFHAKNNYYLPSDSSVKHISQVLMASLFELKQKGGENG